RRPAAARRLAQDRGRRVGRAAGRRLPRREAAALTMATLVFLEHHDGELQKGSLGVLSKAASLGEPNLTGVLLGSGVAALALEDSVVVEVGWRGEPRLALFRSGVFDPAESGGEAEVEEIPVALEDFSQAATMLEQAHEERSGPSIEDAEVIVAGGRGLGGPE